VCEADCGACLEPASDDPDPEHDNSTGDESSGSGAASAPAGAGSTGPARWHWPSVTVLKPLKGADDEGLEANLRSFVTQAYPGACEVILSVADRADPALALAQRVCAAPGRTVPCRVIVGDDPTAGLNPKVANLLRGYEASTAEFVLISDSNIRVDRLYLRDLMRAATVEGGDSVALLSSVVRGVQPRSLGSLLGAWRRLDVDMFLNVHT
jgi:cellulose synthase/poly-beta-1,6-N-acetylglucosamine synthase-like glycosyltransferase